MGPLYVALFILLSAPQESLSQDSCTALVDEAHSIRQEGYAAIDKADRIRDQAYLLKDEAIEMKEESVGIKENTNMDRSRIELALIEAVMGLKSQGVATSLYIADIRDTLREISLKVTKIEENAAADIASLKEDILTDMSSLKEKIDTDVSSLKEKIDTGTSSLKEKIDTGTSSLKEDLEVITENADTQSEGIQAIKRRQQTWLTEVRMISLYKIAEQNIPNYDGRSAGLITDGQFTFEHQFNGHMRTWSHSVNTIADNKIWVKLGGTFKITRIVIWNLRHCCVSRIVGSHIYADEKLIGAVIKAQNVYTFDIEEDVFAQKIVLHQPLTQALHILEMQVWGMGPFPEDDLF